MLVLRRADLQGGTCWPDRMGACRLALALLAAALAATAASTPLVVSSPTLSLSLGAHAAALAEAAAAGAAAPSAGGSVSLSLAPSVVDFGAMPVSTLGSATLRLRNTALRRNLTVLAVLADERRFYLREQPFAARTLVPGEQFALELLFLPHAPGAARGVERRDAQHVALAVRARVRRAEEVAQRE